MGSSEPEIEAVCKRIESLASLMMTQGHKTTAKLLTSAVYELRSCAVRISQDNDDIQRLRVEWQGSAGDLYFKLRDLAAEAIATLMRCPFDWKMSDISGPNEPRKLLARYRTPADVLGEIERSVNAELERLDEEQSEAEEWGKNYAVIAASPESFMDVGPC